MDRKTQDLAWSVLPKEFKEEVKKLYAKFYNEELPSDCSYGYLGLLIRLFGIHNLTSDAEGEEDEILHVSRKKLQYFYKTLRKVGENHAAFALQSLFGSKCLPDDTKDDTMDGAMESNVDSSKPNVESLHGNVDSLEPKPAEAKFKVGDKIRILSLHGKPTPNKGAVDVIAHINAGNKEQMYYLETAYDCAYGFSESDLEPYAEPDDNHIADPGKMVDAIIKDGFSKERRLNIAAMAMQGMIASGEDYSADCKFIAKKSLEIADALIAECQQTDKLKGE